MTQRLQELDVALGRVRVIEGDTALTPDQGPTYGSLSIQAGGVALRQAAATARQALVRRAAELLRADAATLRVEDGMVLGASRRVSYAELVGGHALEMKVDANAPIKAPADRKIVGRSDDMLIIRGVNVFPTQVEEQILRDPQVFAQLMQYMTVPVSDMFRDPPYFAALRRHVVPVLRTYPSVKIWIAGCSTGEEVYSMAILLREEGLLDKTILYATDINSVSLEKARQGIFPLDRVSNYTSNYQKGGGLRQFSDYYTAAYNGALTVSLVLDGRNRLVSGPLVLALGLPGDASSPLEDALDTLADEAANALRRCDDPDIDEAVESAINRAVKKAAYRIWERRPVVETAVLRV